MTISAWSGLNLFMERMRFTSLTLPERNRVGRKSFLRRLSRWEMWRQRSLKRHFHFEDRTAWEQTSTTSLTLRPGFGDVNLQ